MFLVTNSTLTKIVDGIWLQEGENLNKEYPLHLEIDSRKVRPGDVFVCLQGERVDGHNYVDQALQKGARGFIVEKPLSTMEKQESFFVLRVKKTSQALLDIATEIAKQYSSILITGSAGKTTTKQILETILPSSHATFGNYNTPIGLPVAFSNIPANTKWILSELSASYPGEIETILPLFSSSEGAILTGIGNSHTEFFSSTKEILNSKALIFENVSNSHTCFANGHLEGLEKDLKRMHPCVQLYGFDASMDIPIVLLGMDKQGTTFSFSTGGSSYTFTLPCFGKHYVLNAVACIALTMQLCPSLKVAEIQERLQTFTPGKGRGRWLHLFHGCVCIDESYNANPLSMKMSLEAFFSFPASSKILVLGDMLELGSMAEQEHKKIGTLVKQCHAKRIFYIGQYGKSFQDGYGTSEDVEYYTTIEELYDHLQKWVRKDTAMFVKASNGVGLHTLVNKLESMVK
ncbi:MAG: UDP-N-acetylmuramoyl-tripeptide--D-alanyl-D-alanine ligase [Caldisericia bacterium]|nr:UDP-N-acetylmuramoyl-tripeptide--D-alanyl-D-alanine ligase [Caldisericia bacterium]MDD4613938.1 UDP-N-acetylmuramoyl-tripeptide--D-alanyl-D-alanine ligase [Caldisericia bacterium]